MSDQWAPAPAPKGPRRWPRRLAWTAGVLFVLLVILYFFVTSQTFLESFVLPKVAASVGTSVTVGDASISPFRKVVLKDLRIGGASFEEPLLTVKEVRARYSLLDIVGGNINVEEVAIVGPVVQIVQLEDGTSNLDALLNRPKDDAPAPSEASPPPQLHIGHFVLTNATLRYTKHLPGGGREIMDFSEVSVSGANLRNAQAGTVRLGSGIRFERMPGVNATNVAAEKIAANVQGQFDVGLTAELKPESLRGSASVELVSPPAGARDIKGTMAVLECDVTPTELRQVTLSFKQGGNTLGMISAKGPLDIERKEGQINVEVSSIGRHALNLFGSTAGLDFGPTTVNAIQQITIANAGQRIAATGRWGVDKLTVARKAGATPPMDLGVDYDFALDQQQKFALVQRLKIEGKQNGAAVVKGELTSPMRLELGNGTNAAGPSAFHLQLTNFSLADWRAFIGDVTGTVLASVNVTSGNGGKHLGVRVDSRVSELTALLGSNRVERADVGVQLRAGVDGKGFQLDDLRLNVGRGAQDALTFHAAAKGNLTNETATGAFQVEVDVPRLTNLFAIAGLPAATVKLGGEVRQQAKRFGITNFVADVHKAGRSVASLNLSGFYDLATTNAAALFRLRTSDLLALAPTNPAPGKPLAVDVTIDAGLENSMAILRSFGGNVAQAGRSGGTFSGNAQFDTLNRTGNVAFALRDLNEAALAPFVDVGMLHGRGLKNWAFNLNVGAQCQPDRLVLDGLRGEIKVAELSAGTILAYGNYNLKSGAAEGKLLMADFDQRFLGPIFNTALTNKQLTSASFSMDVAGRYDPVRETSVKASVNLNDVRWADARRAAAPTPLSVQLTVDASMATNKLAKVERFTVKLAPTSRAQNELNLSGAVDLARAGSVAGELQLVAESLDVTPYYELLEAKTATNAPTTKASTTSGNITSVPGPSAKPQEPEAVKLPFGKFNLGINIGQLYLREIAVQNWQTTVAIDGSRVQVAPLQLALNGAPVKGSVGLNLGVPGYQYDVALSASRVALGPLADSFAPEQRGKVTGEVFVNSQIKGAGVTGGSLQKNLAGNFSMSVTNANFKLTGGRLKGFFTVIGYSIGVPDLTDSPISRLSFDSRVSNGTINIAELNVVSETFIADTKGDVKIAEVLANSPLERLPMNFWLRRSLAQRLGKIPRATPPEATYVKMPDFVRVAGTVSAPKPELNKGALAGAVAERFLDGALKDKTGGVNPLNLLGR